MLETILTDVINIFRSIFLGGDVVGLVIAIGAIAAAAVSMQRGTQIGSMTLLALMIFAAGGFIRAVARGVGAGDGGSVVAQTGNRVVGQINQSWSEFYGMEAGTLLAWFIAFMMLIFLGFGIRTAMARSGGGGGGGHH